MPGLNKNWLQVVPWETVVSINAALCEARKAFHKPTSDGYVPAKDLWERSRLKKLSLPELLQIGFQCHPARAVLQLQRQHFRHDCQNFA